MIHPTPTSLAELIVAARAVTSHDTFEGFVRHMKVCMPGPAHPHEGVLSGRRVQDFQNWLLVENYTQRLTDAQLLAIMRAEFPLAEGAVFTGSFEKGLAIVSGIRAHFNRDGHNGPSPRERGLPASVSYGRL